MLMHRVVLVPPANGLVDNPFPAASADPGHFLSGGDRFWWTCQWKVVPDQESEYALEWKSWEGHNTNPSTVFCSCHPHAFEHGFSDMRPSTAVETHERCSLHDQEVFGHGLYASTRLRSLLQWNPFAVAPLRETRSRSGCGEALAVIQLGLDQKSPVFSSQHTHTHVRSTMESDCNIREFLLLMFRLYTRKLLSNDGGGLRHNASWAIYWCWFDEQLTDAVWVWVSHRDTNQWHTSTHLVVQSYVYQALRST